MPSAASKPRTKAGKDTQPGIYVERQIRGSLEEVWRLTQTPELHQRWDMRFTRILYLPRASESEPQKFLYKTRIGLGLAITGTGESLGDRTARDGSASSALKFASDDPKSLIRAGSGYWRYIPVPSGVRFLTWYDYEVRFGALGRLVDRALFRPLMGWATAWSFDRMALWVEQGQTPETSLTFAAIYAVARVAVAFVWIWHGLVPKLLARNPDEQIMLARAHVPLAALPWFGAGEIVFGLMLLLAWRQRWLLSFTIILMMAALTSVAARSPQYLVAAFNPVTLNLAVIALAAIGSLSARLVPTAQRCRRRMPQEGSAR